MRHRVIHGVVVAILVALVRTGYADSASADAVEPAQRLDLAAIVIVPSDVGQPGFGRLGGATETIDDQVRHLVGSDDVNAVVARETLRNAGFRRRYASALALPIHPGAARVDFALRIDAYAIEFTDATGAKTGFEFLRTLPVAPDASQIPGIGHIGDLWEATSGTLVRQDGRTHLIQDLRFQDGNLVVGVTVTSDADGGAPPDISMLVSLAETMERRLASIRKENEPGLGALVVRLDDEDADPGIDDAYLRANGETFPAYNQPQDDLAELTERFGPAQTVYALDQAIGIPETDPEGPPYLGLWLLRFPSPAAASAWLAAVDRGDPELGYSHRRSVPDAVPYGDESLTFSYRFAASNSLTTRGYQIYARVGAEIARVQIDALPEAPLAAVEELAEAQVACLRARACPQEAAVPATLAAAMAAELPSETPKSFLLLLFAGAILGLGTVAGVVLRETVGAALALVALVLASGLVVVELNRGPIVVIMSPGHGLHAPDIAVLAVAVPVGVFLARYQMRRWRRRSRPYRPAG